MEDALPIRELAARSGVPVATIKFYLRDGLLPRGAAISATHALYGERHVRRLGTIRTLSTIGGLRLREVAAVVAAIDGGATSAVAALAAAGRGDEAHDEDAEAAHEVDRFVDEELGWRVAPDAPARRDLALALSALRRSGRADDVAVFRPYARAAGWLVTEELEADESPDDLGARGTGGRHRRRRGRRVGGAAAAGARASRREGPMTEVVLRETTDEDLPILFAHQAAPVASTMAAFPLRDWEAFVAHQRTIGEDGTAISRTVVADGVVVGAIGELGRRGRARRRVLDRPREHWGGGSGRRRWLRSWTSIRAAARRARAAHNAGSRRVLEKSGFRLVDRVPPSSEDDVEELVFRLDA